MGSPDSSPPSLEIIDITPPSESVIPRANVIQSFLKSVFTTASYYHKAFIQAV